MESDFLKKKVEKLETEVETLEGQIIKLEKISERREGQIQGYTKEVKSLEKTIDRMEKSLLNEFKISQGILKSMVENDWEIERTKLQLEQEIERKKQELDGQQRSYEIESKQQGQKIRRELIRKIVLIFLPVLTALATGTSLLIQKLFE